MHPRVSNKGHDSSRILRADVLQTSMLQMKTLVVFYIDPIVKENVARRFPPPFYSLTSLPPTHPPPKQLL